MPLSSTETYATELISTEIRAQGPDGDLVGTLVSPPDSIAVVLIIPGSGPTDRDGNNPLGVKAQTYKLLAEGLAQKGIASVRIDKRGTFSSSQAISDANAVTIEDYVEDTLNWVNVIQQRMETKGVWLMGHSEGGLIALATATKKVAHPHVCGIILIATPGCPAGQVLKKQIEANPANLAILTSAIDAINAMEVGRHIPLDALPLPLKTLFRPNVQCFLISLFSINPAELIEKIEIPILIVQGARDLQVDLLDAEQLQQHQPLAELAVFPDANHLMKHVATTEREENIATYFNPDLPLVQHLVETIAEFVARKNV